MKHFFLLTAFGKDRPGIVAEVTETLFHLGGNIEDASMTRLGGEFTMMLVVGLPAAVTGRRLQSACRQLAKRLALNVQAKPVAARLANTRQDSEATYLVSVYGTDKPGIVYRVAKVLANRRINITDLNTKVIQRSGEPFYVMLLEVHIPPKVKVAELSKELEHLGRLMGVEITLQDIEPVAL
jgi:glycine cleavage system transcriptional repressor